MTAQLPSREDVNNALFRLTTPLRGIIEKDSTALMDKVALEKIAAHLTQITNAYCALLAAHEQEPVGHVIQQLRGYENPTYVVQMANEPEDGDEVFSHPAPVPAVPMAVAGFDAATAIRACMDEFPESMHDIIEECAQIAENTISTSHAAPVPAVPDEINIYTTDRYAMQYAKGWNACRAAMLNGGKS
ncbi:hypothetical protein [Phytobacter diazotrophicus]|uniref:hypothetical protein n=1 Tax=Phytobacter diazotrophicus TaxID=395631 RepID=UPI00307625D1